MSNTTTIYTTYQPDGSPVVAIQDSEKDRVAFAGVVNKARFFSISTADRLKDLMTRAINNRTRERRISTSSSKTMTHPPKTSR